MRGSLGFQGQQNLVAIGAMVLLAFSVFFGGASRQHELRLALVELAALPLIVLALPRVLQGPDWPKYRLSVGLFAAVVALPLIQLIPMPSNMWMSLPNRHELTLALELAGLTPGWVPLSLTPDKTWRSFLALLPPLGMYLGVLTMAPRWRLRLIYGLLAATLAAVLLGSAQVASGGEHLYPWRTTSSGAVVGFFANRNHLATLCLVAIPFFAALGARAVRRDSNRLHLWAATFSIGLLIVALGIIRSRTGLVLVGPVIIASLVAGWLGAGRGKPRGYLLAITAVSAAAIGAIGVVALPPIIERFDRLGGPEGRLENWPIIAKAAESYLPFGSGIGSFDSVFRSVEPLGSLDPTFFNQAHNDYLETWLETGLFGAVLLVGFLFWFGRQSWNAWSEATSTRNDLRRASTIGIAVVLAHSAVDYPLRTATIATIFALMCGLLEAADAASRDRLQRGPIRK